MKRLLVITLLLATSAAAKEPKINSRPEYLRAYVAALRFANDANQPFLQLAHLETGTPEQLREFVAQSRVAQAALERAAERVAPFMASRNPAIAKSAGTAKRVFEGRQRLCERWRALYEDMTRNDPSVATRFAALRDEIDAFGRELGDSAVAAAWGIVKIDRRGNPTAWGVNDRARRRAVDDLRTAFGASITAGPKAGMNYVETAAAALSSFLVQDRWHGAPRK